MSIRELHCAIITDINHNMNSRRARQGRRSAALALLAAVHLPSVALGQTRYVCGTDYDNASLRCTVNPTCPTGDGCPADQPVCFALEAAVCFSPPPTETPTTGAPTGSPPPTTPPTPAPLKVCGLDYSAAFAGCLSNQRCDRGDGCGAGEACFNIPHFMCGSDAPTEAPTPAPRVCGRNAADAEVNCPDAARACAAGGCGAGEASFASPAGRCGATPRPTPGPTARPTDPLVPQVCGADAAAAMAHCPDPARRCPTGTECGRGEACFTVPEDLCGVEAEQPEAPEGRPTPAPVAAVVTARPTAQPVTGAPTATPEWVFVCGVSYGDAADNVCKNPNCASGEVRLFSRRFLKSMRRLERLERLMGRRAFASPRSNARPRAWDVW